MRFRTALFAGCLPLSTALCLVFTLPLRAQQLAASGSGTAALRAARVIDGTGSAPITDGVVVVTDGRIVAVGAASRVQIPAGARIVNLGDATLSPGFIDMHAHLIGRALEDKGASE